MKRGTIVKRIDNGQSGVVYKDSGEILKVIITSGIVGRQNPRVGSITTWHSSKVKVLEKLCSPAYS